jgi:hypothetical protein
LFGETAVDASRAAEDVSNCHADSMAGGQLLRPVNRNEDHRLDVAAPDDAVERLREDLRRLAADLDAVDRRDAAQHGGLKRAR